MHPQKTTPIRQYFPSEQLKPYIRYFIISEREPAGEYKVLPSLGPVIGLQYSGQLSVIENNVETRLNSAEITGISDRYKIFKSSAYIGTILIYFNEVGFTQFTSVPANELFRLSLSLEDIFVESSIRQVREELYFAVSDEQRIGIVERFLCCQLDNSESDKLVAAAARIILATQGTVRMKYLADALFISQSPLEKRFKRIVGTSPKKFASIVRFNYIIGRLKSDKSLIELSYENNFYDQAHFSKEFKKYTGETPESFKSMLEKGRLFATEESSGATSSQRDIRVKAVEQLHL